MGNSTEKLADLLVGTARQDRRAFAELYERTCSRIYGMLCGVIPGSGHDDVMQEVFVLVWQRAGHYDPAMDDPMAWLMALAHRHAVDHAREGTTLPSADSQDAPNPSTEWENNDSMPSLPPNERESIMMAYGAGMSYQSVAASLGVTEKTVRGRIRHGVRSLNHSNIPERHDER